MANQHGWLVIDKPLGMNSRAVVDHAQKWFPRKTAIGHAGTLDPLATGVLVLAVGNATRLVEYVQGMGKVYEAEFTLGATSATDDAEGPITPKEGAVVPSRSSCEAALARFVGVIEQVPPNYSAVWVDGKRAYKEARKGRTTDIAARPVRIDSIKVLSYDYPRMRVEIHCGKGTYIRSLARDLGAALGCGGYVSHLRRTAIGGFTVQEAVGLDSESPSLLPLERGVAGLPRMEFSKADAARLQNGGVLASQMAATDEAAAFLDDRLIAIVAVRSDGSIRPLKVMAREP